VVFTVGYAVAFAWVAVLDGSSESICLWLTQVCDESARMMTNEARTAVIEYLSITMVSFYSCGFRTMFNGRLACQGKTDDGHVAELSFPVHPALQ